MYTVDESVQYDYATENSTGPNVAGNIQVEDGLIPMEETTVEQPACDYAIDNNKYEDIRFSIISENDPNDEHYEEFQTVGTIEEDKHVNKKDHPQTKIKDITYDDAISDEGCKDEAPGTPGPGEIHQGSHTGSSMETPGFPVDVREDEEDEEHNINIGDIYENDNDTTPVEHSDVKRTGSLDAPIYTKLYF